MNKKDHDALIIFVLAFAVCGLHGMKSCQERKEEQNGQHPATRSTILPKLQAQETKILQFNYNANPNSPSGSFGIGDSDTERLQ